MEGLVAEGLLPVVFKREINQVRHVIEGFRLKVPLVGKFSAGKSSLVNCWLDREAQEVDLGACTSAPVEFHHCAAGQEKLVVQWAPAAPELPATEEEFADAYMPESRIVAFAHGRRILHIERHCDIAALSRYPDLVVVDTPGIGSSNLDHDTALAHYLGDGVLFILCANRGQVGTDELAFVRRQRQLGQEFSLLVCQEDLNNPSERERLQRSLAEQAGLTQGQLVRGCSARDRNLAGFEDLLAHVDRSKTALFVQRHRPLVEALVQRAERLLVQHLEVPNEDALRQRMAQIGRVIEDLDAAFQREGPAFLSDCAGSVTRAVVAEVRSFMRARRTAYAERIQAKQEIRNLVVADAQNAFELSTRRHFTARLERAAQAIEQQTDIGRIGTLKFPADESVFASAEAVTDAGVGRTGAGAVAGAVLGSAAPAVGVGGSFAAFGAAAGSMLPGLGTAIGGLLGGLVGNYLLGTRLRVTAESQAAEAIELICAQVEGQTARLLEAQTREALAELRGQLDARIQTEREQSGRIEAQLHEHAAKKEDMKKRAGQALAQVRAMVREPDMKNRETMLEPRGSKKTDAFDGSPVGDKGVS
jgi:hypothetical protein